MPTYSGGFLSGVTVNGDLDLSQNDGANLTVYNGLVLNGTMDLGNADGTTSGYVHFGNPGNPAGGLTGNATVLFGGSSINTLFNSSNLAGAAGTLTIGPTVTIHGKEGALDTIDSNGTIVNQGTINADTASGTISVSGAGAFTNTGTIEAIGGGSLTMSTPPTNLSSGTLTGATWIVGSDSSMSLGANVTTDAATIILNGTGASFSSLSKLAKVAAGGSLQLLGGASLATTANLDNAGTVDLAPGTWNVTGNYTQEATGILDVGVGGLTAGSQFSQLNVSSQATLDGTLNVSLLNGYAPSGGGSYRILTFGSRIGGFATVTGLSLARGQLFHPHTTRLGSTSTSLPRTRAARQPSPRR